MFCIFKFIFMFHDFVHNISFFSIVFLYRLSHIILCFVLLLSLFLHFLCSVFICPSSILTDTPDAAPFFLLPQFTSFCFLFASTLRFSRVSSNSKFLLDFIKGNDLSYLPPSMCVCVFCVAASKFRNFWEVAFEGSISLVPSRRKKKCTLNVCRNLLPCQRGERRWSLPPSKEKQQPSHKGLQLS